MRTFETIEIGLSSGSFAALPDQDLFRVHFDNLPRPAYIWRREGKDFALIAYNRAAAELPHSDVASLIGKTASVLQAGSAHDLLGDLENCANNRVIVKREVEYSYIATGVRRTLDLTIVPLSADIVVLHTEDVTERRLNELALRDSEKKYRTIVDTAHEGILASNLKSEITYANRRAAEMLGYTPEEMLGRSSFDFIDPAHREEAARARDAFRSGERTRGDFCLRHKSGAEVWVSAAVSQLFDPTGQVSGLIYMNVDITERKRAEQALRESESRVRALLDANPDLILRLTRDGTYLDAHSSDSRVNSHLPVATHDYIGRNVRDMFEPEFVREHERYRLAALATGRMQRWEYVRKDPWGSPRHVEARFVKSGEDEVVVTVRDFTDRIELEREVIASSERERTRIGQDLHDGLAQLLIGVKLLLAALGDKLGDAGSPHRADAERAAELVSRAIAQTSELAHGLSPIPRRGRLADALRQLARESEQILGVDCDVVCMCEPGPTEVNETTATNLYRIAQEAITNAVKHGKASRVEVRCGNVDGRVELTIADDGTGIGEADPASNGGGLGLHIMSYRARSIGGDLSVQPRAEGGTLVRCRVPLAQVASSEPVPEPEPEPRPRSTRPRAREPTGL
ncbi:MAG TPA: PAS domain S-box protein [Gammaproteobacteria bacterium]|nr:PAS domain S-box protein [Gammaproteobacteria bacterium]